MKKIGHSINRFPYLRAAKRGASLLALVLVTVLFVMPAAICAQEPTPRPTPTPTFLLELTPQSGMPGTVAILRGYGFQGAAQVDITWDDDPLLEEVDVRADGSFEVQFEIPEDTAGEHVLRVIVVGDPNTWVEIIFDLYLPTATPTLTFTPTLTPTYTPRPTNTRPPTNTPPPTSTPLPTMTPTPKPTLRPATPIRLQPTAAPATPTYVYHPPTPTAIIWTPTATFMVRTPTTTVAAQTPTTLTPMPAQSPTGTFVTRPNTVTATAVPATPTPAPTKTPTITETPTMILAPTVTETPTATVVVQPADETLAPTGGGTGPFAMVVTGGLLLGIGALGIRHLRANMLP